MSINFNVDWGEVFLWENMNDSSTNQQEQRIVWMLDSIISAAKPEDWGKITALAVELINRIGNPNFEHEVVNPLSCWIEVARRLKGEWFSCVIDLTRWLTPALQELFRSTPIEHFSISRVHVVTSHKFDKSGYLLNDSSLREIQQAREKLDLSRLLIVDDVAFSGRTAEKTMELWNINPESATFAFLVANTGSFGTTEGPVKKLGSKGGTVIFGHELKTPVDDGFHIKDFLLAGNIEQAFVLSSLFQEMVHREGGSPTIQRFFENETVTRLLFPNAIDTNRVIELINEGRFVPTGNFSSKREFSHAANPLMWVMPSFIRRSNPQQLIDEKDRVCDILRKLSDLTSDPEGKREAGEEFRRETQGMLRLSSVEGQTFKRGKEIL